MTAAPAMPMKPSELGVRGWRLAFGEVIHSRLRAPARALDEGAAGNWLFGVNRPALLSLHAADHGRAGSGVNAWLRGLLDEAGVQADGEIWLHTFPRVLGYAFKPVSFWFCHRADGALAAVVAEVNNTFGERHCYLLAAAPCERLRDGQTLRPDAVRGAGRAP
jgi:DUF1365 family protein